MRVVIDARAIGPRFPGIGRATLGLLRGLHTASHEEQLVVSHQLADRECFAPTGALGDRRFSFVTLPATPLGAAQQWQGPRLAWMTRADLWHAPYYVRPLWGLPATVVTVFDTIGPDGGRPSANLTGLWYTPRRLLWELVMRRSLLSAARIITSSAAAARDLQTRYALPARRISVVPLAADDHFRPQLAETSASLRHRYALPADYVLYVGSNKPHKNLQALIESWAILARDYAGDLGAQRCLVIAGREDPRYRSARVRRAELGLDGCVRFLPDVPDEDLPALYAGAICFVFPSLQEGFGLPPLEAMACGTPVVASNRTSLPEVVGDAGLLVTPEPHDLASGIRRLLVDAALRQELRGRGLRRAAGFSWERTAVETLRVYRQVAG